MKAFALTAEGQPAAIVDLPEPEPGPGEVRVRVHAASVNGFDVFQAGGALMGMMPHELPTVIGRDFAGVVDAVGSGRDDVAVGDEVLGFILSAPPLHAGSFAEFVTEGPKLVLAPKPAGISFVTAAAIPLAGSTALDSVDAVAVGPGDTVVVAGATGGVGSFAVQFAAQRGATVIATAKPGDEDAYVRALGATETIDYSAGDVADAIRAKFPDGVDALIDTVNRGEAFTALSAVVRDGGRISTTLGAADVDLLAIRDIRATNVMGSVTPEKLTNLAAQVAAGTLKVEIQATFPLDKASAALAAFGAGTRGKVVLDLS